MDAPVADEPSQRQFPCRQCGAMLAYAPGTQTLRCPYCGTENDIPREPAAAVEELDYHAHLAALEREEPAGEVLVVHCDACGAETTLPENVTADRCPFCGASVVAVRRSKRQVLPRALLPFHVTEPEARAAFRTWVGSLWFAPNDLKRYARHSAGLNGLYVPYWTYDCRTVSDYTGQRGDDYWTTESYTVRVNGRTERRTRQVRRTRWSYAAGRVHNRFNDVLVLASRSLPPEHAQKLEPWDLPALVPYRDEFLSGFRAESYQVGLEQGFDAARSLMEPAIRATIRRDIGGDHQRIHSVRTSYFDITFKHVLLPVWLSAYRYRGRTFRFLVNARTGEVQGERPWSAWKIFFAVLLAALVVAAAVGLYALAEGGGW